MRKLVLLVFSVFYISAFAQETTCSDYKIGTFKYNNPLYKDWIIKRTAEEQIETNTATGLVIHNDVKWLSDCEFILTCQKVSQPQFNSAKGKMFRVVITETTSNGYTCISMKNDIQTEDLTLKMIRVDN